MTFKNADSNNAAPQPPRPLHPQHREHLRASGLTDETIERRGYWSCDDAEGRKLLAWPSGMRGDAEGLVIPYPNVPGYVKVRTDHPRPRSGKWPAAANEPCCHDYKGQKDRDECAPEVIKYEAPLGSAPHVFVPSDICPAILHPAERLYITEGEKKAEVMCQQKQACVSIPGVSSAHDVEHRRAAQDFGGPEWKLHPQLRPYVLPGREVCLLFDTPDMDENPDVIRACVRTARMVAEAGAVPLVGYIPVVPGQQKTGVDDYFVATMMAARQRGAKESHNPLQYEFAEARPAAPSDLINWMNEQRADGGWEPDELLKQVRRAAIWVRIWHERDEKKFQAWVRRAAKTFFLNADDIKAMVADVDAPRNGSASAWRNFDDKKMLEQCVPLLNSRYRLLGAADGTERVFSVNERNEATLQHGEANQRKDLHDFLKGEFGAIPPDRLLKASIVLWKKETDRLTEEPEAFCFASDDRICFKRFDWEPTPGPFPAWEEFLSRLSDREAFMAFIWSCFEKRSKSRQYAWLRGEGQDGKSKVLGVIYEVFGTAAAAINNAHTQKGNQFFFSAVYGKRVVIYPDCKNSKFGMSEIVRNSTSGDAVPIEFKGETPFTAQLRVKLFVASNPRPEFTSQTADRSRIIYIEVAESANKDDPTWEDKLRDELPGFLWACRETYNRICPHHGDIPLGNRTKELLDEGSTAFEEEFHNIFETYFTAEPTARTPALEVWKRLKGCGLGNDRISDFKTWAERVHGVHFKPEKDGRFYLGLALRPEPYGDGR